MNIEQLREFARKNDFKIVFRQKNCPADFTIFLYDNLTKGASIGFDGYFNINNELNLNYCINQAINYISKTRKLAA